MSTEEITAMLQALGVTQMPADKLAAIVEAADTDGNGDLSFDEFFEAMNGSEFAALVVAATHPADVARKLEEANAHFLASFNDFVTDSISSCQKEVMAAKVPIASYGRVKSAVSAQGQK